MRLLWSVTLGSMFATAGDWLSGTFGAMAGWALGSLMEPQQRKEYVKAEPPAWYVSPGKRWHDGRWLRVEGIDPMNEHALDPGPLGEHARWWLRTQMKYDRRATRPWSKEPLPPPISTMSFERTEFEHEVAAWLLTAYAVWRALR